MVLDPDRFQIRSKKVSSWKQESLLRIHGQLITADVLYTNALFSSNVEFRIIHEFVEKSLDCTICFLRNCRMWNRLILFRSMNNTHSGHNIPSSAPFVTLLSHVFSGLYPTRWQKMYFVPVQSLTVDIVSGLYFLFFSEVYILLYLV
jgi:hypothetical protein